MNLYVKLREMENEIKEKGEIVFKTPYGKNRAITGIDNGYICYERDKGTPDKLNIDLLYRDYLLLKDLGSLSADNLKNFNKKYKNGKEPCDITTFMLLMEYLFECTFIRGKKNAPSIITWQDELLK